MTQVKPVLVVDLGALLLRSDLAHEAFWALAARSPLRALARVLARKSLIAEAHLAPEALTYNPQAIDYIEKYRSEGGEVALICPQDPALAERVAEHLNLPADPSRSADPQSTIPFDPAAHTPPKASPRAYLRALRPHQWAKNVLVFLPMLAGHKIDLITLAISLIAFYSFSLIASSVYVLNDLLDLSADRAHPRKRNRPLAAGAIPIRIGTWLAGGLLAIGLGMAAALGGEFVLVMAVYYVLTLAYSISLKRKIIIDIFALAALYTIRIIAGGIATDTPLSVWLLAFSLFFFLSLAAVKRQAELVDSAQRGKLKTSGRAYHVDDLPIIGMIGLASGYVSVLVLALYVNSPEMLRLYASPAPIWGVCAVVLYWVTRMVMVTHRGEMHDDPVVYAAKDRISHICFAIILALVGWGSIA